MDEKLTIFIAITAAAVVLQMLILLGMYMAVRKLSVRMEALADKVEDTTGTLQARVLPVIDNVKIDPAGGQGLPGDRASQG